MRFLLFSIFSLLVSSICQAQYSTPGNGLRWDMDSLVTYSAGVVTEVDGDYEVSADLIISETDTLYIQGDITVSFASSAEFNIFGLCFSDGGIGPTITSLDTDNPFQGIRMESGSKAEFTNTTFIDGGGLRCISGDLIFTNCTIENQVNNATTGAAIDLFTGSPEFFDCTISFNEGAGISSPANIDCAPLINGCFFEGNNYENSNRPQINLGPSGPNRVIIIENTTVIGDPTLDQVGGIATSSLFGGTSFVFLQNNVVNVNRYGIAVIGNGITATILDNIIVGNNTQGDPLLGGSGINLNGNETSSAVISDNTITANLWGITVQNDFQVDMGNPDITEDSPGDNTFNGNGNGGEIYALYNNTPSPITAVNNCWIEGQFSTEEEIEDVIFHAPDDNSLGEVNYSFYQCGIVDGLQELLRGSISLYPNPVQDQVRIALGDLRFDRFDIVDVQGRTVLSSSSISHTNSILVNTSMLVPGPYIVELRNSDSVLRKRFVKE